MYNSFQGRFCATKFEMYGSYIGKFEF